jgi:hypothetical protein
MKATQDVIESVLAKCKKAKRIAVMNFVTSATDNPMYNSMNLEMDAASYKWNADTVKAIRQSLRKLGKI